MILRRARWRLTLGFAAVQLVTFGVFAISVYAYVTATFDFDALEGDGSAVTAEAGFATLRTALWLAVACLLVVAPVTSWLLAGLAMRPVATAMAAQRRFVDDAAHELRTPLTAVQAQLELALRRPRTGEEYRDAAARALDAANALGATVDDLLAASAGPGDRMAPGLVALDEAVLRARALLPDPSRVHLEARHDPHVEASATAVQRVLLNLLVNACRYSPDDTPVMVRIRGEGRWAIVEVVDQGIGMSPTEIRRAFDPFWQADASRAGEGSGLGLSIVRDIVTSLRGRVAITSTQGTGTNVTVRLPLSRSSHAVVRNVESTADPV